MFGSRGLNMGWLYRMFMRFFTHFFYSSVSMKSFPWSSRSRLYLEISIPMKRFRMKKLPRITAKTKKIVVAGCVMSCPGVGARSLSCAFEARYIMSLHYTEYDITNKDAIASGTLSKLRYEFFQSPPKLKQFHLSETYVLSVPNKSH